MARPSKHDGVLYKRTGSKIWWMRYRDRDRKRYLESTNTEDWQQAQQKLRERLQARDQNTLQTIRRGEQLLFNGWVDFFLENYSKPPIHGWALQWMMEHGGYSDAEHLAEAYEPISKWTEWYFRYRDTNGDGLPEYNHGNDSGWDNSTVMLSGIPVETPDLDSFLILQMDALSVMARKLGKEQDGTLPLPVNEVTVTSVPDAVMLLL